MTKPEQHDPLQPVLKDAEAELSRRLHEACEAESSGLSNKSSDEIREIEDSLLRAAVAAGQTIALRRYMKQRNDTEGAGEKQAATGETDATGARGESGESGDGGATDPVGPASGAEAPTTSTVREFQDSAGQMWRAWPVIPGVSRTGRPTHYLGEYQRGWICFESLDSSSRRRLPCAPTRLAETKDEELERLLAEAIAAPERKTSHKAEP